MNDEIPEVRGPAAEAEVFVYGPADDELAEIYVDELTGPRGVDEFSGVEGGLVELAGADVPDSVLDTPEV